MKKRASIILYIIALFTLFLAFCSFAIDGTIIFTKRFKLQNITESTALAAAQEFDNTIDYNSKKTSTASINANVREVATKTFNILKNDSLENATMQISVDTESNKVLIKTECKAQTYFLAFLGVKWVNLKAKACATSEIISAVAKHAGINWLTNKAAYISDILFSSDNLKDTAILFPLGNDSSASIVKDSEKVGYIFNLIDSENNEGLNLGPGGYITIKLPTPILDKTGYDLEIDEAGALEGYMVFAGIDKNPDNPYVNANNIGDGISWTNISACGISKWTDNDKSINGEYYANTNSLGSQRKVYGSNYFDISNGCAGNISMIKYLRIVDDNSETAFVSKNKSTYYKTTLYGESNGITAGADIDAIKILNHVKLINSRDF